ncbi:primase 1D-like protein [Pantoea agglomerans]|uniref:primase 1D-like protein n=1 Tax=Enterobacter agglomerans TaxID=549 RepID=UPI00289D4050|nr:hypothetical protein [Pantoea agglomerans]WNK39208.1 hypothetical protein RM160_15555 [Pantoea agglomerans]
MNNFNGLSKIKINRHPINLIGNLQIPENAVFTFSDYLYDKKSFRDIRSSFNLPKKELNENWFINHIFSMDPLYELALHSSFEIDGEIFHIPMIDFTAKRSEQSSLSALKKLSDFWETDFLIFFSGRSFHAYGVKPITDIEWVKFMGSLLLLNVRGTTNKLIDTRWVGHRILAGYSALRWSKNTSHYKAFPAFLGYLSELKELNYQLE